MKEEWRIIKYFTGYMVSNCGQVKSIGRIIMRSNGSPNSVRTRLLSLCYNRYGYLAVNLCKKGEHKKKLVHRLVGEAFMLNPENKPEINHIDGVKDNNCVENLEWCTHFENSHHALLSGLLPQGEDSYKSLLTNNQVGDIKELLKQGQLFQREIAELFGVSRKLITSINTGRRYKNV